MNFFTMLVNHGVSVGFSGTTSSGKTTDISFLLNSINLSKRIYTIEENRELDLTHEDENHVISSRVNAPLYARKRHWKHDNRRQQIIKACYNLRG